MITKDQVLKALDSLEEKLSEEETVSKSSETDLDQAEGADLGNPVKEKLSDAAKSKQSQKSDDGDEDLGGDDDDGDLEFSKKSFSEDMPEEVQTKIDVSDFLKSLVDHTASSVDGLREQVAKSELSNEARMGEIAETMTEVIKSQAKIGIVLKAVCQRIGILENSPAAQPKAETLAKSEGAQERSFSSGLAQEQQVEEKMFKSLSDSPAIAKSQISNALCDMVMKGEAQDLDVIGFETSGHIRPELVTKLKQVL